MIKSVFKKMLGCMVVAFLCTPFSYAQVSVKFNFTANGKPVVLNDSSYSNAFNETYQVSRLKFYISHLRLSGPGASLKKEYAILVDAAGSDSIPIMQFSRYWYDSLEFMIGVDSALNCSGAQDGALDPMNGMFWTWNSGYIFFKLEGYSPSSKADLQRIEHHVGGYRYPNNVARKIQLQFPKPLVIKQEGLHTITVNVDLDKYWKGINDIKIAEQALLMTPGGLALQAADNIQNIFSVISVE